MSEIIRNLMPSVSLVGVLGFCRQYPKYPEQPFREDKKALSNDWKNVMNDLHKAVEKVKSEDGYAKRNGH